jgi:2-oxoisovalerate dehydrogenase E1 component
VLDAFVASATTLMAELADVLLERLPGGKPGQRRIKESEWPDPSYVDVGVAAT